MIQYYSFYTLQATNKAHSLTSLVDLRSDTYYPQYIDQQGHPEDDAVAWSPTTPKEVYLAFTGDLTGLTWPYPLE